MIAFGEWDWDILANEWDVNLLDEWGLDLPPMFDDPEPEATEDDYDGARPNASGCCAWRFRLR
jgi:hypothetical protein